MVFTAVDELMTVVVMVLLLATVVELLTKVVVLLTAVVVLTASPTPTQYEEPSQKLVRQSSETSGFHSMNCSCVIP